MLNPLVSVLVGNSRYGTVSQFPFQPLGLAALLILFLMAATSHDFWLHNLTAPVWKTLHMGVYAAYALIVLHVLFGVMQGETGRTFGLVLTGGVAGVFTLQLLAARQEARADREHHTARRDGFVDVCAVHDIPEKRAFVTCLSGERVAVFRYDGLVSAISSVCQHQNGPLGEGRVVNGCVVCPWHGYEYDAGDRQGARAVHRTGADIRRAGGGQPRAGSPTAAPGGHARRARRPADGASSVAHVMNQTCDTNAARVESFVGPRRVLHRLRATDADRRRPLRPPGGDRHRVGSRRVGPRAGTGARAARGRHVRVRASRHLFRHHRRVPGPGVAPRRDERCDAVATAGRAGQAWGSRCGARAGRPPRVAHRHADRARR